MHHTIKHENQEILGGKETCRHQYSRCMTLMSRCMTLMSIASK